MRQSEYGTGQIGGHVERATILRFFAQGQDTWQIGRLLQRPEQRIERQLHVALDTRRAVRESLGTK